MLEADKPLLLELKQDVKFLVTSADVIHSFSVPSGKLKIDCIPGRLKMVKFFPMKMGVFFWAMF